MHQPSRAAHSLGISSIVLGIFSFFVCWLPFVGFPLSGLGFLLGVVGLILALTRKDTGIGYSIAGTAVNCVGLLLGFVFISFIASRFQAADQAVNRLAKENTPIQAQPVVPTQPTRPEAKPTPTGPTWTKADTPLRLGSVELRITEVVAGDAPLRDLITGNTGVSEKENLAIWVEVANTSERKKIDYEGWMSDYASVREIHATLGDDAGNYYRKINFLGPHVIDGAKTSGESIYPGKSIRDAIVFELPIEGMEYLRLKLSAKGCNEEGEFRFEIPKEMIKQAAKTLSQQAYDEAERLQKEHQAIIDADRGTAWSDAYYPAIKASLAVSDEYLKRADEAGTAKQFVEKVRGKKTADFDPEPEKTAVALLKGAKGLETSGEQNAARSLYKRVAEDFPRTKAGAEARSLLRAR